ncbi:MAG: hypothetical protein AAF492_21290, partial [Verrucomicrobiota bacterium]
QLAYMLDETRNHQFHVILHLETLNPLRPDFQKAEALLEAIELKGRSDVVGLEIMRDAMLGPYRDRMELDYHWSEWIKEQYGSVRHAEAVVDKPLWTILEENLTGPVDQELITDGKHDTAVAVYRRFVDDYISRKTGVVRRFLKSSGYTPLICIRGGPSGNSIGVDHGKFPVDLASGSVHADLLLPSGLGLHGNLDRFYETGFLSAYARGVSGGKPILWAGLGVPMPGHPDEADRENQERVFMNHFLLATRTYAGGLITGSYADWGRTAGILNPDGSLRPAGKSFRGFVHRLRDHKAIPREWKGREVDRFASARGFMGLWDAWRETYKQEIRDGQLQELRPLGFNTTTRNMPLKTLRGLPFDAPAPFQCANAEWGVIRNGEGFVPREYNQTVRVAPQSRLNLEWINTGAATWDASEETGDRTVWITAEHADRKPVRFEVPETGFGESVQIEWTPQDTGVWTLRGELKGVGAFGEPLHIEVIDSE